MMAPPFSLPVCPRCGRPPSLTEGQLTRLRQALAALPAGKSLSFSCPGCRQALTLSGPPEAGAVVPPPPPVWLDEGPAGSVEQKGEAPAALILCRDSGTRRLLEEALAVLGYQARSGESAAEALDILRFQNFACVVLHTLFEGGGLGDSRVHDALCALPMVRRRGIFYILLGPGLSTLYELQALALSANLVVGEGDLPRFGQVLRRAIPAHEALFGPLIEARGEGRQQR